MAANAVREMRADDQADVRGIPKCNVLLFGDNAAGREFWHHAGWSSRPDLEIQKVVRQAWFQPHTISLAVAFGRGPDCESVTSRNPDSSGLWGRSPLCSRAEACTKHRQLHKDKANAKR